MGDEPERDVVSAAPGNKEGGLPAGGGWECRASGDGCGGEGVDGGGVRVEGAENRRMQKVARRGRVRVR